MRPAVFFRFADRFRAQAQRWDRDRVVRALEILTEAELECKTTGVPAEAICQRTLMRLAGAAYSVKK